MLSSTASKVMGVGRMFPNKYSPVNKALGVALGAGVAALVVVALVWASPAWASTITVNSLADTAANDGKCTLREAITAANTNTASGAAAGECPAGQATGADLIDIQVSGTVELTGALPDLESNMDIEGPGADQFTVRRNTGGDYGIFFVLSLAEVSIEGMTITNGNGDFRGGGILNDGTLTVTQSTISGNSAFEGGGISNQGISPIGGGTLKLVRSTVSGNSAFEGGGIYSSDTAQTGQKTTITNSTISGNSATSIGGGVYNFEGLSVIEYSTITNNTAPNDQGSGVASRGDTDTSTQVLSSIISANTNTDVDFVLNSTNSFDSEGYNLIGDGNATGAFNQSGDQSGVADPKLNELGYYGGPTQTHALKSGSLAINAIPQATNGCGTEIATDQRGVKRAQGGKCEIGSFEDRSPWVTRVIPQVDSTSNSPLTIGYAYFSEEMRPASINANTIKLFKKGGTTLIGAQVEYDARLKRAILTPDDPLELGVSYRMRVNPGVKDLAKNLLDQDQDPSNGNQPKMWFFTVRN